AGAMAIVGGALLVTQPGDQVMSALGWFWPPALLVLAMWMMRSVRRALPSRTRAWIVQPICAVLAIAAVAGAAETVIEATDNSLQAPAGQTYGVAGHKLVPHGTGELPQLRLHLPAGVRRPAATGPARDRPCRGRDPVLRPAGRRPCAGAGLRGNRSRFPGHERRMVAAANRVHAGEGAYDLRRETALRPHRRQGPGGWMVPGAGQARAALDE